MSQSWYVKHNGKSVGPYTPEQMRELSGSGKIKAETEVRRGDDGTWILASKVKGLIQEPIAKRAQASQRQDGPTDHKPGQPKDPNGSKHTRQENSNPYQSPAFTEDQRPAPTVADAHALKTTRAGLYTIYYGICAVLFAIAIGSLLMVLGVSVNMTATLALLGLITVIPGMGGYIAILVGQVMCLTVPQESGGKGQIQIAVAMQALSIVLAVGGGLITAILEGSGSVDPILLEIGSGVLSFVNSVLAFVGYLFFLYFIKSVAIFIARQDLASSSSTVMKMVIALAVMLVAFPLLIGFVVGPMGIKALAIAMLIVFGTFLLTFIRYANLVGSLARAIPK